MTDSKNTTLLPAYLIVGDDALKRDHVMQRLRARLEKMGDLAFNSDTFGESSEFTGADVVSACNTVPFASPVRLVEVRAADKLLKADAEQLVSYLASPCETTVLALVAEKLAKNTRLYKAVAALGKSAVIACDAPKARELPKLVRDMAVAHGVTISPAAAQLLVDLAGEDTVRLDAELKKLSVSHSGSGPISDREVREAVARTAEVKPWEFVDAFAARDTRKCLQCLGRMKSESPFSLLPRCTSRLRELICAKSLQARGQGSSLASVLKVPAWRVKNHAGWARNFHEDELRRAIIAARDVERAMKSGADADEVFREWVVGVTARSS